MKTIIVGRGRSKATQREEISDPTVSREHCVLTDNGDGTFTLENKSPNGTMVDGRQVLRTRVTKDTCIQLSATTTVKVADLLPLPTAPSPVAAPQRPSAKPQGAPKKEYSIAHLKDVWENFQKQKHELQNAQMELANSGRLPMMISTSSSLLGAVFAPAAIAGAAASLVIQRKNMKKAKELNVSEKMELLQEEMMDNYVCPNPQCNHFLGLQAYKLVLRMGRCPRCGSIFVE